MNVSTQRSSEKKPNDSLSVFLLSLAACAGFAIWTFWGFGDGPLPNLVARRCELSFMTAAVAVSLVCGLLGTLLVYYAELWIRSRKGPTSKNATPSRGMNLSIR